MLTDMMRHTAKNKSTALANAHTINTEKLMMYSVVMSGKFRKALEAASMVVECVVRRV
jgi:hypothetical protein